MRSTTIINTRRLLAFAVGVIVSTVAAVEVPTVETALRAVGLDAGAKDRVLAGEIVARELAEGSDKELAAGLVLRIRAPLAKLIEAIRAGKTLEVNRDILAFGTDLDKLGYTADEAGEAFAALNAAPGAKFNFSDAEIKRWRALKAKLKSADPRKDPQALAAINAEYRAILSDRLKAYQAGGVKAIAPYARGKTEARPAEELALAMSETRVAELFPDFQRALADYPSGPQAGVEHEFLWFKQRVEKRPVFILAHRMSRQGTGYALLMERQIYVGVSYNSNQTVAGGREENGNVIALYGNRCFSDQVAGTMSGLKHGIGRGQMIGELKAHFENVRKLLEN